MPFCRFGCLVKFLGGKCKIVPAQVLERLAAKAVKLWEMNDLWELYVHWSMRFPVEEEVKGLGIGNGWVAAATSQHLLRVYSEVGLQVQMLWKYIFGLQLNLQFCFSAAV